MLKLSSESIHGAQWVVVRPPWHLLCWVSSRELRLPRLASALYARVVGMSTECPFFWPRHWEQWEERIKQEQSLVVMLCTGARGGSPQPAGTLVLG